MNGAKAWDIDKINGERVKTSDKCASDKIQEGMRNSPNINENYGPNIIEKRNNSVFGTAKGRAELKKGHQNHIHGSSNR
jgi:hypothetical protein